LVLARRTGDRFQLPAALASVGTAALVLGDLARAEDHLAAADAHEREVRPGTPSSFFLEELRIARAAVTAARGDQARARAERDIALRYFEDQDISVSPTSQLLIDRYLD
jgi:hypothetical protein